MPVVYIDVAWLLDVQEQAVPEDVSVADYSALVAAVARHKTRIPRPATAEPEPPGGRRHCSTRSCACSRCRTATACTPAR